MLSSPWSFSVKPGKCNIYSWPVTCDCRLWDTRNMTEVKKVDIPQSVTSMVLSKDGSVLVVTYDRTISFWNPERWVIKNGEWLLPL